MTVLFKSLLEKYTHSQINILGHYCQVQYGDIGFVMHSLGA